MLLGHKSICQTKQLMRMCAGKGGYDPKDVYRVIYGAAPAGSLRQRPGRA